MYWKKHSKWKTIKTSSSAFCPIDSYAFSTGTILEPTGISERYWLLLKDENKPCQSYKPQILHIENLNQATCQMKPQTHLTELSTKQNQVLTKSACKLKIMESANEGG